MDFFPVDFIETSAAMYAAENTVLNTSFRENPSSQRHICIFTPTLNISKNTLWFTGQRRIIWRGQFLETMNDEDGSCLGLEWILDVSIAEVPKYALQPSHLKAAVRLTIRECDFSFAHFRVLSGSKLTKSYRPDEQHR